MEWDDRDAQCRTHVTPDIQRNSVIESKLICVSGQSACATRCFGKIDNQINGYMDLSVTLAWTKTVIIANARVFYCRIRELDNVHAEKTGN